MPPLVLLLVPLVLLVLMVLAVLSPSFRASLWQPHGAALGAPSPSPFPPLLPLLLCSVLPPTTPWLLASGRCFAEPRPCCCCHRYRCHCCRPFPREASPLVSLPRRFLPPPPPGVRAFSPPHRLPIVAFSAFHAESLCVTYGVVSSSRICVVKVCIGGEHTGVVNERPRNGD